MKVNLNQIELTKELLLEGKIEKITEKVEEYLRNLSNRDYQKFDEKYVKVIFYSICRMLGALYVKSELEVGGKYSDLVIIPTEKIEERYSVLVEFKYIKQEEYDKNNNILKQKQEEAKNQIQVYSKTEEIKLLPNVRKYSVVTVKDKIYVEEIK